MIPYVYNLFPVCGGLFYNHLQAADTWRNCSPLASTLRVCCPRAILDPFQSAQGVWSLLKHSRRPHLISASVKLVPIYLAESKGTHQGVVTVLENEGVEKNQKVTLEGKESLRSIKGSQNVSSSIDPTQIGYRLRNNVHNRELSQGFSHINSEFTWHSQLCQPKPCSPVVQKKPL